MSLLLKKKRTIIKCDTFKYCQARGGGGDILKRSRFLFKEKGIRKEEREREREERERETEREREREREREGD